MQINDEGGNSVGELDYNKEKYSEVKMSNLKLVVNMYEANKRQGNASTKTRSEVSGSGKKPWAQKHLGRARAGSVRSPLWRGGGVSFGPKPRDYSNKIPKKLRWAALNSAITSKLNDDEVVLIDKLNFEKPNTKKMALILNKLNIGSSCLVILQESDTFVWKSARNIKSILVSSIAELNAYDVIKQNKLLITKDAMETLNSN